MVTRELGETWWIRGRAKEDGAGEGVRPAGGSCFHPFILSGAALGEGWAASLLSGNRQPHGKGPLPFSSSRAINSTLRAEGPRKPQLPSCERSHRGQLERGEDHRGPQKGNSTARHRSERGVCVCARVHARVCATQTSQEQRGRNSHTHALKRRGTTAEHEDVLQPLGRSPRQQLRTVAH